MPHPLRQKVAQVRRRARRMVLLYGLSCLVGATLVVALLLGLVDYLIRFQDPGIRIMASGVLLAVLVYTAYEYLVRPLARPLRDVDVAQRIERRYPQLNERLSSAVEFLGQREDDFQAGSATLRRAVIHDATAQVAQLDLEQVIDPRPTKRALSLAAAVVLFAALVLVTDPLSVRTAVVRLAAPLGSAEWPQKNRLAFKEPPTRLAVGQPFEAELIDLNGNLPEEVRIHYRFADGPDAWTTEVDKMKFSGGSMFARRDGVVRPFEYRAEGGDDHSMEWTRLEVIEPPLVESFEVTLYPPAYTGWGPTKSDKRIRALRGTQVALRGTSTKRLSRATLKLDAGTEIAGEISDDGFEFSIAAPDFIVDKSGSYGFLLTDTEGVTGGIEDRWDIRAVTDAPPSLSLEQPADNLFVTEEAVVPLRLLVKDDLAIHTIDVVYSRSDRTEEGEFERRLYEGPPTATPNPQGSLTASEIGESRVIEHAWNLADLQLAPGTQLSVLARASDYFPQVGQTVAPRRITIITPAQLEDRLAERQAVILSELARTLKMQRDVRGQTSALEIQLNEVGELNQRDLDDLQAAELNQRQVTRTLTSTSEGIPAQIASLLAELESNRVDSPEIERRMRAFQAEIVRLEAEPLPLAHRELTSAFKSGQAQLDQGAAPEQKEAVANSLAKASQAQEQVMQSLEQMLGDLSQWADYRRFARDIRQIRQEHEQIQQRTQQLGQETLTKQLAELTPQQRAELQKLAREQLELSRQLDKSLQGMEEMGQQLAEKDPLAAAALEDALHQARQEGISGQMRQAGRDVAENRMGQAVRNQENTGQQLGELLDILSNRRENELSRLVDKLREAEKQLQELREKQQGLQKKIEQAQKNPQEDQRRQELERLRREQQHLEEEASRLARRLKRLNADRAGQLAQRGAARLGRSRSASEAGDQAAAGSEARRAQRDLDEAQEQLAQTRRQAEEDLAREQLARFEDTLKGMIQQQDRVHKETARLETIRTQSGRLTRAQTMSLNDVARQQERLAEETTGHGEKMRAAQVFQLALDGAAHLMREATELLLQQQTGTDTQQHQRNALARLHQLLEAVSDEGDDDAQQQGEGEQQGGGEGGNQQDQGQQVRSLAELKLLRLLQVDLQRRTAELREATADSAKLTAEQQREIEQLAAEQGRLADLVFDLLEPMSTADENPEQLPGLEEQLRDDALPPLDLGL